VDRPGRRRLAGRGLHPHPLQRLHGVVPVRGGASRGGRRRP